MATEKNPLDEYLSEKTATGAVPFWRDLGGKSVAGANTFMQGLKGGLTGAAVNAGPGAARFGEAIGRGSAGVAGAAAATGALAGATYGAQRLYDAATKARDFRSMLDANPDLVQKHQEDPRVFNQMFSTLRTFNPAFTRDPIVAGSYVRRMVEDPLHAGAFATDALQFRDKTRNQLGEQVTRSVFHRAEKKQ